MGYGIYPVDMLISYLGVERGNDESQNFLFIIDMTLRCIYIILERKLSIGDVWNIKGKSKGNVHANDFL